MPLRAKKILSGRQKISSTLKGSSRILDHNLIEPKNNVMEACLEDPVPAGTKPSPVFGSSDAVPSSVLMLHHSRSRPSAPPATISTTPLRTPSFGCADTLKLQRCGTRLVGAPEVFVPFFFKDNDCLLEDKLQVNTILA
jgi:hypothetical protein